MSVLPGSRSLVGGALACCLSLPATLTAQSPDALLAPRPAAVRATPSVDQPELANGPRRAGVQLPATVTPIHTAEPDLGVAYGIWAATDSYKVSFHDGMTFVPYLGSGYPHNQPLSWRTTSVRVGQTELLTGEAVRAQQDYRYEYRFGAVTEAYDVRAEGLEQTFVVTQLPAAGDLVVTGVVDSLLRAPNVSAAQQALQFVDAQGRAVIGYGRAIAFDADGDAVAVSTAHQDGKVTLTVPGSWLAHATLPVTIDPLLTRVWVTDGIGIPVEEMDIARDDFATTDNVMFAYVRSASATDRDLFTRLSDDTYSAFNPPQAFTDVTSSWDTDAASVAFVGGSNRWVLVFRRYFANNTTRSSQLRCHVHASGDTTLATNYSSLVPPAGSNDWRPDVGGVESYASGSDALVVWQREDNSTNGNHFANSSNSVVLGSLLDTTTVNGSFGTPFVVYSDANSDCERPSVNKVAEGGAAFSWVCVLQAYNHSIANDDWDLIGKRIDNAGQVTINSWYSDVAYSGEHQLGPVVEGSGGRYAVAFTTTDIAATNYQTTLIAGKDLLVERFNWVHGHNAASGDRAPVVLRSNIDRRWEATGLAYDTTDDSHFVLGFRAVAPGVPTAYYARVGYNGEATEGPVNSILYYTASRTPSPVACVFDNDHDTFAFGYGVDDGSVMPLYGHTLEYAAPTPWSTAGTACSNAVISWSGNQQIGSEFNRVLVGNAPPAAGHFLLVSLTTANVPVVDPVVFPGCRLLVQAAGPGYLGMMSFQFGPYVSWNLALPEWLDPMTLHFQDWLLDGSHFYSTQRLSVPIVK